MPSTASRPQFKKLRLLPLLAATYFMVSGGPYGLEDIIGFAGYGRTLILLAILPFLWSLPTALMIGELASTIPDEGGFYAWVRRVMGPFWGFQEAWLSLSASIFDMAIYPTLFVTYLSHVAPWVIPDGRSGLAIKLSVVLISTLWNLRGAYAVGAGSVRMWFFALSPYLGLVAFAFWRGLHMPHAHMGAPTHSDYSAALLAAMWNYMGWDNATTIAGEVEDPQRDYPRVMVLAALMVMCTYLIPIGAVAWAGIPAERFSTGAWADAGQLLGGPLLALFIVLAGSLDSLGTFNALTMSYTRLPYAMACDGLLPSALAKQNRYGVPWVSLLLCAVGWSLAFKLNFEHLLTLDLTLWGLSLLLEFIALIILRRREPNLLRPFRIPGPDWFPILLGMGPAALTIYAIYASRSETAFGIPALLFTLGVAALGVPLYWIAVATQRRKTAP